MSEKTQIDLENLWEVGSYLLPSLATIYANAAGKVHQTRNSEAGLFETPGMPEGTTSPVLYSFGELRDHLQNVSRKTCINLRDSGSACVKAADEFSRADLSHAERIDYEANKTEYGKDHKVTPPKNPPTPTDPVK